MPAETTPSPSGSKHVWRFARMGGLDQVRLETADDFRHLATLDQKLWVALSCPTRGLEIDERTLALIDGDGDGHVRAAELIAAVQWTCARLKDPGILAARETALALAAVDDCTEDGARVLAAARHVLAGLGRPDAATIAVDDTADLPKVFAQSKFCGDGVLTRTAAGTDAELQQLFDDIIATVGGVPGRGTAAGVDGATLGRFFDQLQAHAAWAESREKLEAALGADALTVAGAFQAVQAKVADYFVRCRLATFDSRATGPLNRTEADFVALAARDLAPADASLAALPLARIEAGRALPLTEGINPAWDAPLAAFRTGVVDPVLGTGRERLTEADWEAVKAKVLPCVALVAAKPAVAVEGLGLPRIRALLAGDGRARLEALQQQDLTRAPEFAAIDSVVRLVRYHRDLGRLLNNFVCFDDFYSPDRWATFQAGTLYLDSRSCELCIEVADPAAHARLATLSRMYIAYCDCRRAGEPVKKIAVCITQGDSDYLMPGRNGVFYDHHGRDWDATITRVIDNAISVRQAFWLPYKKLSKFIGEQVSKIAAAKEKAAGTALSSGLAGGAPGAKGETFDIGKFAGIFAAIGLAVGYLAGAVSAIVLGFAKLAAWQMPLAVLGVLLLISGPSVIIAWLKLRQRTLGPVLDANGWAINGRVKVNVPLGTAFTEQGRLPANAMRSLDDPFADKRAVRRRRILAVFLVVLLALAAAEWWFLFRKPSRVAAPAGRTAPAAHAPAPAGHK